MAVGIARASQLDKRNQATANADTMFNVLSLSDASANHSTGVVRATVVLVHRQLEPVPPT